MKTIYCDMDGVLADFNNEPNAVERFEKEKGFFYKLKPLNKNVATIRKLAKEKNVFILSASPNANADKDKIEWLKKNIPEIKKENIIICRNGQKKLDFMKTENGILFDDYGKNIAEWEEKKNNKGYKIKKDGDIKKWLEII